MHSLATQTLYQTGTLGNAAYYRLDVNDNSELYPPFVSETCTSHLSSPHASYAPNAPISQTCALFPWRCIARWPVHRYGIRFAANYYCHLDKERSQLSLETSNDHRAFFTRVYFANMKHPMLFQFSLKPESKIMQNYASCVQSTKYTINRI